MYAMTYYVAAKARGAAYAASLSIPPLAGVSLHSGRNVLREDNPYESCTTEHLGWSVGFALAKNKLEAVH